MEKRNLTRDKKKVAEDPENVLLTGDEAGFNLLSSAQSTYAPCGQTPILQQDCKYSHLSVIGAISTTGDLTTNTIDGNFKGAQVVTFLKSLLLKYPKNIYLIWDGARCHCGQEVKDFLTTDPDAARLHLYRIPPYSPELNPTEQLWNNLKNVKLKNVFCKTKAELGIALDRAIQAIKNETETIAAFFRHPSVAF